MQTHTVGEMPEAGFLKALLMRIEVAFLPTKRNRYLWRWYLRRKSMHLPFVWRRLSWKLSGIITRRPPMQRVDLGAIQCECRNEISPDQWGIYDPFAIAELTDQKIRTGRMPGKSMEKPCPLK